GGSLGRLKERKLSTSNVELPTSNNSAVGRSKLSVGRWTFDLTKAPDLRPPSVLGPRPSPSLIIDHRSFCIFYCDCGVRRRWILRSPEGAETFNVQRRTSNFQQVGRWTFKVERWTLDV